MRIKQLKVLTSDEIHLIHNSTIELLETVGIRVESKEALILLKENGAIINEKNNLVYLPESLVMNQLCHDHTFMS